MHTRDIKMFTINLSKNKLNAFFSCQMSIKVKFYSNLSEKESILA